MAAARAFIPVLAARRAQAFAVRAAQGVHGDGQQHILAHQRGQVEVDIIAYHERAFRSVFGRVDEQFGEAAGHRLLERGQAPHTIGGHGRPELPLSVQTLGSARETDRPAQAQNGEVIGYLHRRFVKLNIAAEADAFFEDKPDI